MFFLYKYMNIYLLLWPLCLILSTNVCNIGEFAPEEKKRGCRVFSSQQVRAGGGLIPVSHLTQE